MRYRSLFFAALSAILLALPVLSGCSGMKKAFNSVAGAQPEADIATTEHNPVSLWNYRTAREYSTQGRFELAREHYLLAYAAAEGDPVLRDTLQKELHSVDLMIKTLR